jgi:hypothetical protein
MKAKTIRALLKAKVNEWVSSIKDENLQQQARNNTIITGGCIPSMLLGEKINDFDVYFRNKEVAKQVALYYVILFNSTNPKHPAKLKDEEGDRLRIWIQSSGVAAEESGDVPDYQFFEQTDPESGLTEEYIARLLNLAKEDQEGKDKYRPIFLSSNAITLSDHMQIIIRFYGEPDEIHENYDFEHCKNYWTSWDNKLVLPPTALECLLTREIRYGGSKYPLCSLIRTRKFIKRGWTVHAGQYLKMCMQLGELDLTDCKVLEEQLIGVDTAYFKDLLDKIRGKKDITAAYVIELIDNMV